MIGETTRSARHGAEQFTNDSGSRVTSIRRAGQGVFQILARDNAPGISADSRIAKTIRVASAIDYALAD
jgi:uncharacterized protein